MNARTIATIASVLVILVAGCSSAATDSGSDGQRATSSTATPSQTSTTTTTDPSVTTLPPTPTSTTPSTTGTTVPLSDLRVQLVPVADDLRAPVLLVADPDGGADFVVEQRGRLVRLDADRSVALDLRSNVRYGGERGLLGLAFHPAFATNRLAYVNYTGSGSRTFIEEFEVGPDGVFDVDSRRVILTVDQPARNHNGGMIGFGPDGYLWIGMGDGGGSNDRYGNGQRGDTLLGAMLRIAVGVDGLDTYGIPADNPQDGYAPEVWWIGLRNPWRFSFDGNDVWIADVGQNSIEEINVVPADRGPVNLGWPIMEGSSCFGASSCDGAGLWLPVDEYTHAEGCSVTGGYVYRGSGIPELTGHYFYSDFCSGFLRSILDGVRFDWTEQVGSTPNVSGFGIGGDGELYVVSLQGGVSRLERSP